MTRSILVLLLLLLFMGCNKKSRLPETLTHSAYVWQRVWGNELVSAIKSDSTFESLQLLTYQIQSDGSLFRVDTFREFVRKHESHNFTAVVRISPEAPAYAWDSLPQIVHELADTSNPSWQGVQIDYDCPESQLKEYEQKLRTLRKSLPEEWQLSITALPTWCNSRDLKKLVSAVDYSVVQVHSVDNPQEGLFSSSKALEWITRYGSIVKRPFYAALPCYGSKLYLHESGSVAGVESEAPRSDMYGLSGEELHVDPASVDSLLNMTDEIPWLQGFLWFRLPTELDERSWSKEVLDAVIQRKEIASNLIIIQSETEGTTDISVRNEGFGNAELPTIIVQGEVLMSDALFAYDREFHGDRTVFTPLSGEVLTYGEEIPVGWIRGGYSVTISMEQESL